MPRLCNEEAEPLNKMIWTRALLKRPGYCRYGKLRAVALLLNLTAAVILLSVSVAAAADLHPEGFDDHCNLCQFSKAPLVKADLQLFLAPSDSIRWEIQILPVAFHRELVVLSGLCRAPPA